MEYLCEALFFLSRRTMEILGMSEILGKLKKEKHNLLWQRSRDLAIKHNFHAVKTKPEQVFPTVLPLDWSKSSQKKIGLNGLLIHDYPTGLSRYSYELIRRILTEWEGNSVAYSASPDLNREFPEFNFYQCSSF